MTNEQFILSNITEKELSDMFTTGNVYHTRLNNQVQVAFEFWKKDYKHKRSDNLLFQIWLTFQYSAVTWEKAML